MTGRILMAHTRDVLFARTLTHHIYTIPLYFDLEKPHYDYIIRRESNAIILACAVKMENNSLPLLQENAFLHRATPPVLPGTPSGDSSKGQGKAKVERLL